MKNRCNRSLTALCAAFALSMIAVLFAAAYGECGARPLNGNDWKIHYINDIMPYWTDRTALGEPIGNFPSKRDMNGKPAGKIRYSRMIARQVYAYLVGYNLTGDERLLEYALAGAGWIASKAKDPGRGYFARLSASGKPDSKYFKSAQDQAYVMLAFSALYYVTRDPAAKRELDENIALIFDGPFWDGRESIIKDALTADLSRPVEFENPGHDIVTVLDQANAYLELFTNCLEGAERAAAMDRLKTCGDLLASKFFSDGIFWDTDANRENYRARHLDAGHVLKTYWMLYEIARLWKKERGETLYAGILDGYMTKVLTAAYSEKYSMWGKLFKGSCTNIVCRNPDWWMQCECNQLASRLLSKDPSVAAILEKTTGFWLDSDFVDRTRKIRGIRDGVGLDGKFIKNRDPLTVKAHDWKNGYHESEQALVLYLALNSYNEKPSTLYFAVPPELAGGFRPTPYMFGGKALYVTKIGPVLGGRFVKMKAVFGKID